MRRWLCILWTCAALTMSVAAQAQDKAQAPATITKENRYYGRYINVLKAHEQYLEACSNFAYFEFLGRLNSERTQITQERRGFLQLVKLGDASKKADAKEAEIALVAIETIRASKRSAECDLGVLTNKLRKAREACDREAGRKYAARMQQIYRIRRLEYEAIKAAGKNARFNFITAKQYLDDARLSLEKASQIPWNCPPKEKKVGDASEALPDLSKGENISVDAVDRCMSQDGAPDPCASWRPLLGLWRDQRFGGVLGFTMDGPDTVSAHIVSASNRMKLQGYSAGMVVMRGLKLKKPDNSWSFVAGGGDYFSAAIEDREPSAIYGTAEWVNGEGFVFITTERPGILNLVASLEGRLSDFEEWERMGSVTEPM